MVKARRSGFLPKVGAYQVNLRVRCKNLNQNHGSAATTEREGLGENQVSDSLDCTDGKGAEVAEMTTRLS